MPCFTALSNELYFEILRYLPPPDLGSFFCINKHLYALTAIQRIKHSSLKRRFSTSLDTKQPGSTARLIKSISDDPQIAIYVQHFTINGPSDLRDGDIGEDQDEGKEPVDLNDSDLAQLKIALRDLDYLSVKEVREWIKDLIRAPEEYLINLALTLFSNLTSIDIRCSRDFEQRIYQMELLEEMMWYNSYRESSVGLFAKLTSVTVSGSGDYYGSIDLIEAFATLPSVKIINAERISSGSVPLEGIVLRRGSNVSDLNMSNALLSPHRLTVHLQNFEWLQSFTYSPTSDPQRHYDFDAFTIITALSASAQNSLRELHIRSGSEPQVYMGNLRGFRVLEYLETDAELLFGNSYERSRTRGFSASLPSSIEEVKLHRWHSTDRDLRILLTDLTKSKNDLPNLRSIEFFETTLCEESPTTLEAMCASVNISLKITDSEHVSLPIYNRHRGHYAERQAKKALTRPKGPTRESLTTHQSL